jgi:type I restriction enzyme S subunit
VNLRSHPYESYRPSNSEWIDQTPSEWQEQRVKDLFRLVTDKAPIDNDHELLSLYASIGVRPRKDLEARGNKASSTDGYWLVKKGDIVVNKLLAWMGSVGLSEYDGVTSPAYDVLRKTSKLVDVRYFSYLFRTEIAKQIFKRNSRGIMDMRLRLYFDKLGAITVPVPPFSTQQAIATYIDTKTAQIDRQIDLLGQKATQYGKLKQSLIAEVVTRGLNKSAPMKDSGVEWVGEMPAHWEVKRLKEIARVQTGNTPPKDVKENYSDTGCLLVKPDELFELLPTYDSKEKISSKGKAFANPVPKNSILVCCIGSIGKLGIAGCEIATNQQINALIFNRSVLPAFAKFMIFASKDEHLRNSAGNVVAILSMEKQKRILFAVPALPEQAAIADYLDKKTAQIDHIVTAINGQIDKLKDLRKALINDVVTGKIKVVSEGTGV